MKFVCILMLLITVLVLAPVAQPRASGPEQRFEVAVVKHYNHHNDLDIPQLGGLIPPFGCYVGPSRLQYNCSGSVTRLVAEALNLSKVGIYLTPVAPTSCGRAIRGLRSI